MRRWLFCICDRPISTARGHTQFWPMGHKQDMRTGLVQLPQQAMSLGASSQHSQSAIAWIPQSQHHGVHQCQVSHWVPVVWDLPYWAFGALSAQLSTFSPDEIEGPFFTWQVWRFLWLWQCSGADLTRSFSFTVSIYEGEPSLQTPWQHCRVCRVEDAVAMADDGSLLIVHRSCIPSGQWAVVQALSAYHLWRSSSGLAAVHLFCLILYGVRSGPKSQDIPSRKKEWRNT